MLPTKGLAAQRQAGTSGMTRTATSDMFGRTLRRKPYHYDACDALQPRACPR
jgi:hypothetical protein